jgi:hypothetical protein
VKQTVDFDSQLLGFGGSEGVGSNLVAPSSFLESLEKCTKPGIREELCEIFLHQVDPVVKILHQPSLRKFLAEGNKYLNYEHGHVATEALRYAVYYAAVISLTEDQCMSLFGAHRTPIVARYRLACESALARASITTTDDLTVLQAFVLYLVSLLYQPNDLSLETFKDINSKISYTGFH